MITLKTLTRATSQEIFDQVANHLLTQNKKCVSIGMCSYRSSTENLKCAAGCLIADDEYDPIIEGHTWLTLVEKMSVSANCSKLISRLQGIHDADYTNMADYEDDETPFRFWKDRLIDLAREYKLNAETVEQFKDK